MALLGALVELMNSKEFYLQVGSDQYIGIEDLVVHIDKREFKTAPIDVGPLYRYGFGDNWITATIKATGPEWIDFNTKSQIDSEGDMTSTTYLIKGIQLDNTTRTLTAPGVLKTYDIRKANKKVLIDIFIRITGDEVTVA